MSNGGFLEFRILTNSKKPGRLQCGNRGVQEHQLHRVGRRTGVDTLTGGKTHDSGPESPDVSPFLCCSVGSTKLC